MAYLIVSSIDRELDRLELGTAPVVLGRAGECDLSVHDIQLSRRHCRLTPTSDGWLLIDLASRNGTFVADVRVEQRMLKDTDVITLGKTRVTFHAGAFVPAARKSIRPAIPVAIDAGETMSGTVVGMEFSDIEPIEEIAEQPAMPDRSRMPTPKPRPRDPESFASDDLYSMLEQIASSSWDSIYAVNAQPLRRARPTPQPVAANAQGVYRLKSPMAKISDPKISMALQAQPSAVEEIADIQRSMGLMQPMRQRSRKTRPISQPRIRRFTRWAGRIGLLFIF